MGTAKAVYIGVAPDQVMRGRCGK